MDLGSLVVTIGSGAGSFTPQVPWQRRVDGGGVVRFALDLVVTGSPTG